MSGELPEIFIGSSSEGLEVARAIEHHLHDVADTTIWKDGVFRPGVSFLQTLLDSIDGFDFAVLALTPDDLVDSRDESFSSPRDNVIFELGLFMGRLGPRRTFFVSEEDTLLKLPSDLSGIARVSYRRRENLLAALSPACTVLRDEIRKQSRIPGRISGEAKSLEAPSIEGPAHHLRQIARVFFTQPHAARVDAAQRVYDIGNTVPIDEVIAMTESLLPGERVAAAIALHAHVSASPELENSRKIQNVVASGLDDSRSRVRYRYVRLLAEFPRLASSLRIVLEELHVEETNEPVREEVRRLLASL